MRKDGNLNGNSIYEKRAKKTLRIILISSVGALLLFGGFVSFVLRGILIKNIKAIVKEEMRVRLEHVKYDITTALNHYRIYSIIFLNDSKVSEIFKSSGNFQIIKKLPVFKMLKRIADLKEIVIFKNGELVWSTGMGEEKYRKNGETFYLEKNRVIISRNLSAGSEDFKILLIFSLKRLKSIIDTHSFHLPENSELFLYNSSGDEIFRKEGFRIPLKRKDNVFLMGDHLVGLVSIEHPKVLIGVKTKKFLFFTPLVNRINDNIKILLLTLSILLISLYLFLAPNMKKIIEEVNELVSEIKREFEEVERQKQGLLTIYKAVEELDEGVVIVSKDKRIEYVNSSFLKVLSLSKKSIIGKKFSELGQKLICKNSFDDIFERVISGETWKGELYRSGEDGDHFFLATISPVRDEENRIIKFIGVLRDITRLKRIEKELSHTSKMEAIGRLAGGIAHEFNNLLTALVGYTDVLERKICKETKELSSIKKVISRMSELVGKIILFGRKDKSSATNFSANSRLEEMFYIFGKMIPKNIEVKKEFYDGNSMIFADPQEFDQIILNIILNAIEAMPDGGILTVETFRKEKNGKNFWCVKISDTGKGIEKKDQEKVFDPFFTTKSTGFGRGLGLSIAYRLTQKYGGTIRINSTPGKGTSLEVVLPLSEHKERKELSSNEVRKSLDLSNITVLLAEDEEDILELAEEYLKMIGFKDVLKARNGKEAVEIAKEHKKIDLFFTDIVMPHLSGEEAYLEIKKIHPDVKVLFATGYTVKNDIEKNYLLLRKPYTKENLFSLIMEILN